MDLMWRRVAVAVAAMAYVTAAACARRAEMRADSLIVGRPTTFLRGARRNGRWIELTETKQHSIWFDSLTVRGIGTDSIAGWLTWNWNTSQIAANDAKYSSSVQEFALSCVHRTLQLGAGRAYSDSGSLVYTGTPGESQPVVPQTAGEAILDQLCTGVAQIEDRPDPYAHLSRPARP